MSFAKSISFQFIVTGCQQQEHFLGIIGLIGGTVKHMSFESVLDFRVKPVISQQIFAGSSGGLWVQCGRHFERRTDGFHLQNSGLEGKMNGFTKDD
jgi:hypothetical protein